MDIPMLAPLAHRAAPVGSDNPLRIDGADSGIVESPARGGLTCAEDGIAEVLRGQQFQQFSAAHAAEVRPLATPDPFRWSRDSLVACSLKALCVTIHAAGVSSALRRLRRVNVPNRCLPSTSGPANRASPLSSWRLSELRVVTVDPAARRITIRPWGITARSPGAISTARHPARRSSRHRIAWLSGWCNRTRSSQERVAELAQLNRWLQFSCRSRKATIEARCQRSSDDSFERPSFWPA
jgi:hypothetical protein